ncbi:MAG: hypothetical protein R3290_05915 [Acidimicrobiia bacterium]|nr:hypothetical protein [Acidimicrobiia bacterium]
MGARHLRPALFAAFVTVAVIVAGCGGDSGTPATTPGTAGPAELRQVYVAPGGPAVLGGLETLAVPPDDTVYGTSTLRDGVVAVVELAVAGSDDTLVRRVDGPDTDACADAAHVAVSIGDAPGCAIQASAGLLDGPDSWFVTWEEDEVFFEVTADRRLDDVVAWIESWGVVADSGSTVGWEIETIDVVLPAGSDEAPAPAPLLLASPTDGAAGSMQVLTTDDGRRTFEWADYAIGSSTVTVVPDRGWGCPEAAEPVAVRDTAGCSVAVADTGDTAVAWAEGGVVVRVIGRGTAAELADTVRFWIPAS